MSLFIFSLKEQSPKSHWGQGWRKTFLMLIHPEIPGSDGCGCCQNSPWRETRAEKYSSCAEPQGNGHPRGQGAEGGMQVSPFSDREALARAHLQPSQGSGNPWDEQGRCPMPGGGAH